MDGVWILIIVVLISYMLFKAYSGKKAKKKTRGKKTKIRSFLKDYKMKYKENGFVELESKIIFSPKSILMIFIAVCLIWDIHFILSGFEDYSLVIMVNGLWILFLFMFLVLFNKVISTKKVVLNSNEIKFFGTDKKIKKYNLREVDIRYEITSHVSHATVAYNYYIYTSNGETFSLKLNSFESLIAFTMFINLVKRQKIDEIDNLSDKDIETLQNNVLYQKVKKTT